ncbi:MAG: metalloregulator ArsR/SmtB family transcription factor [Clostridiales bacterium]|nr:metalloregulator ArsR/SmtB family transcription factor [Clostridiales bacterium]
MFDDSIRIFKCLSDKSRLRIVNNLLKEPMYVELLSERLDLAASTVSFHLKKLEAIGLVSAEKEQYYIVYTLNKDILNTRLLDLVKAKDDEEEDQEIRQEEYTENIIKNFFEYGKLKSIPVQRKKRLVVLNEIIKAFEYNKDYTEKEVNSLISEYHHDFCTLRRELVVENLISRNKGIYIRTQEGK